MKELNINGGMENLFLLIGGDFEFYCLQVKNPVGIPKIFSQFWRTFERVGIPTWSETQGVYKTSTMYHQIALR